jgi:hypothetical protein
MRKKYHPRIAAGAWIRYSLSRGPPLFTLLVVPFRFGASFLTSRAQMAWRRLLRACWFYWFRPPK